MNAVVSGDLPVLESMFYDMDAYQPPPACVVRLTSDFIWQDPATPKIS